MNAKNHETFAVSNLTPGMYVIALSGEQGRVSIGKPGKVDEKVIQALKKKGIKQVVVDLELSNLPEPKQQDKATPVKEKPAVMVSEVQVNQAKKIFKDSKAQVEKVLEGVFEGRQVDMEPLFDLADAMIDSVLQNKDAMFCLSAIREKDEYLLEHSVNVGVLMATFAHFLGKDRDTTKLLAIGGTLHDIGKIKVPNEILNKPARLTEVEFDVMKKHTLFGETYIKQIDGLPDVCRQLAAYHHETLDGSGYPYGKTAKDLSEFVRMLTIVDIYDAMTAERCYKKGASPAVAFKVLLDKTPHQVDLDLLHQFIRCVGYYPVGSLVELTNGTVGIVWQENIKQPRKPKVKLIYHGKYNRYLDVKLMDLAREQELQVERSIAAEKYGIDTSRFI